MQYIYNRRNVTTGNVCERVVHHNVLINLLINACSWTKSGESVEIERTSLGNIQVVHIMPNGEIVIHLFMEKEG